MGWVRAYSAMLPRLYHEELLSQTQVAMLPHYSGRKGDKNAGQRVRDKIIGAWRQIALGGRFDAEGREQLRGSAQVAQWFRANMGFNVS